MKTFILTSILFFCISISPVLASDHNLVFRLSAEKISALSLKELKTTLKSHSIELHDPNYEKVKNFRAFKLHDVLNLAFGDKWKDESYTDISFKALDGYEAVTKSGLLKNEGGYIAFEDTEFSNWEPVGRNKANPGPLYLVWLKKDQTTQFGYPWPWQLKEINLVAFKDQFPNVYPEGVSEESPVFAGFSIFRERCLRCHSIDRQGGKVGPDLGAPMNILEYRSQYIVKELIKHPSKYRYTHMPDHTDLSDEDLDNLIKYFLYLGKEKKESK